jgi:3-phenylpropionate/cinnamic acid dioxygenase small subunit
MVRPYNNCNCSEFNRRVSLKSTKTEIENLIKTYAWSMDDLDKNTWLNLFSDNLETYMTYSYGNRTPVTQIPVPQEDPMYGTIKHLSPKQQLVAKCDDMIFKRVQVSQSTISNVMINVDGPGVATGRDYYAHWEIVYTTHPYSIFIGWDDQHWYFSEGKHQYKFRKENGEWKITNFQCVTYRREVRNRQDSEF